MFHHLLSAFLLASLALGCSGSAADKTTQDTGEADTDTDTDNTYQDYTQWQPIRPNRV